MLVALKALRPNPFRDFTVDPVDDNNVKQLTASIKEDGFWGGVVVRQVNGDYQIACGHHRVVAAMEAGIKTADVFVHYDLDDAGMIRVYANENATQRGNTSAAVAGTVAAAVRFLAKLLLGVTPERMRSDVLGGKREAETFLGMIQTKDGIGRDGVLRVLPKDAKGECAVPGITDRVVQEQLAALKSSGNYTRIINEVREEIETEHREALKALAKAEKEQQEAAERAEKAEKQRKEAAVRAKAAKEEKERKEAELARQKAEIEAKLAEKRQKEIEQELKQFSDLKRGHDAAEKATESANTREVTFNQQAADKYFPIPSHAAAFQKCVTGKGVAPYLGETLAERLRNQERLAKGIVAMLPAWQEMSQAFIYNTINSQLARMITGEKREDRRSRRELELRDIRAKWDTQMHNFLRGASTMIVAGRELDSITKRWPRDLDMPKFPSGLKETLQKLQPIIDRLVKGA